MFDELLIHELTLRQLRNFLDKPSHALMLSGAAGSGKLTLAKATAAHLLNLDLASLDNYPHFSIISRLKDKQDISIESIREAAKALSLQIPGDAVVRRVFLIEDAQFMNQEAQNALLKSLEEPSSATVFILTVTDKSELLPTVASRTTNITVNPIDQISALKFFRDFSETEVASAWALSSGAPGLLSVLLQEQDSELRTSVNQAKSFLTMSRYERLLELDKLSKNKTELANLLEGLRRVLNALYRNAAKTNQKDKLKHFIAATKLIADSQQALNSNVTPRLIALKLALSLPV